MVHVFDEDERVVYEGTYQECVDWVLSQAEELSNGSRLYRVWTESPYIYYDCGRVYHIENAQAFSFLWKIVHKSVYTPIIPLLQHDFQVKSNFVWFGEEENV